MDHQRPAPEHANPLDYGRAARRRSPWSKDMLLLGAIGVAFGIALDAFVMWWFLYR